MAVTETSLLAEPRTIADLNAQTHDESQSETDAEILRELGWWLLPNNGNGPEVPD